MDEIKALKQALTAEAAIIDQHIQSDLDQKGMDSLLREVLEYGLLGGGKRVRPLLVVMAARLCGYQGKEIYNLAIAFEYLHVATLFHDDIIDNADTRRGRPSVNKKFGLVPAILAGDYLHARAMQIVGDMTGRKGLAIFCQATMGMVDGEFMQLKNTTSLKDAQTGYYQAIMGKTGLLIAAACQLGALFGGGNNEEQERLYKYGVGLGQAFQMIDDLLDYTGDAAKTGKALGNDFLEGKITLPLILAWEQANEADKDRLETIIADEQLRSTALNQVIELITRYDCFNATRNEAATNVDQAITQLAMFSAPDSETPRKILTGLTQYVLVREK